MNTHSLVVAFVATALAAPAIAASPFDGTWKADLKASKPTTKPRMILVKDGVYECDCTPPIKAEADGRFHAQAGNPYIDDVSIKVVSPRQIVVTSRKAGKVRAVSTRTLSADGMTLVNISEDLTAPDGKPIRARSTSRRIAAAPAGALPVSGSWVVASQDSVSEAALTQTIAVRPTSISFAMPTGVSFDAPLGGKAVPVKGDPDGAMASVRMTGPRTLVETDTIRGRTVGITTYTVRPDGRTIDMAVKDVESGRDQTIVARKQ